MTTPEDRKYTEEHEWLTTDATRVRVGITDYAQQQLGDVVFVELPEAGRTYSQGEPVGEVESTKSVSEIFAPVGGEVTAVNTALNDTPELINSDPYGDGWIFELTVTDAGQLDGLLDAAAYQKLTEND
ncbi:glycine cleavage system protein H [Actinophytocola xinjiangensis]|uniref:Glycine cleavage system H protein n=1 Tax=Actinophytocola xinjiangensis TaxID=485602 RepID=A0A7Z0WLA8_9PSEU|nr:glycine cleavage system protein GcvH [Actinophytocola xinjiangensis]OLF10097.1 glycine cleavage system protein H [Actinophytocola xinjiangensis]